MNPETNNLHAVSLMVVIHSQDPIPCLQPVNNIGNMIYTENFQFANNISHISKIHQKLKYFIVNNNYTNYH